MIILNAFKGLDRNCILQISIPNIFHYNFLLDEIGVNKYTRYKVGIPPKM